MVSRACVLAETAQTVQNNLASAFRVTFIMMILMIMTGLSRKCAWPLAHLLCTWDTFGVTDRILRKHSGVRTASAP